MIKKLVATTLMVTVLSTSTACGEAAAYYPLDELNSNGINLEALNYFKQELLSSNALDCSRVAIKIGFRDGKSYVYVYALDATGKSMALYSLEGDMVTDIIETCYINDEYSWHEPYYSYDVYFGPESNGEIITAERAIDTDILINQDTNQLLYLKKQLINAGYPDDDFSVYNGTLYYGDFIFSGDAEVSVMNILYGLYGYIGNYSFEDHYGVIHTIEVG